MTDITFLTFIFVTVWSDGPLASEDGNFRLGMMCGTRAFLIEMSYQEEGHGFCHVVVNEALMV